MTAVRLSSKYAGLGGTAKRGHKYHAKKVREDGYLFASKAEHKRYCELKLLRSAGEIWQLEVHPRFSLVVLGIDCGTYTPDFAYLARINNVSGVKVAEEIKGFSTTDYKLRARLFAALYPTIHFLVNGKRF